MTSAEGAAGLPAGLILAAPHSGAGKTTIAAGLMRALADRGLDVAPAKVGPDYIDPAFHQAAAGRPSVNLDGWSMRPETRASLLPRDADIVIVEGVMGLFDGAAGQGACDDGSTAALARATGWPVVLIVDAGRMAQSVGPLVAGFAAACPDPGIAGVLLNRVGSPRHAALLAAGIGDAGPPILGFLPPETGLAVPSRHLGLVQACEHGDVADWVGAAARWLGRAADPDRLVALARPGAAAGPVAGSTTGGAVLPPLGQRIAVARDAAFGFVYDHVLTGWRRAGAEICFFSPLADAPPAPDADAVYLPGGYPELHGERLAAARVCLEGLRRAGERGLPILGECGGFMVLGRTLTDSAGRGHPMAGLLPVETSFQAPRRRLGYRRAELLSPCFLGPAGTMFRGHEFHYAVRTDTADVPSLYACRDAAGTATGADGCLVGNVGGAFFHMVDWAGPSRI